MSPFKFTIKSVFTGFGKIRIEFSFVSFMSAVYTPGENFKFLKFESGYEFVIASVLTLRVPEVNVIFITVDKL